MKGVAQALRGPGTAVQATFVHLSGSKRGRRETLRRTLIRIGTAPECALRFSAAEDRTVSPRHAHIRFEDSAFLLTDLGSAAGTLVKGLQVSGGPSLSGHVVGFNYAVAQHFGGASSGVPIRFALALLPGGRDGKGRPERAGAPS